MKNIALINGTDLRALAFRPLLDGKSAVDRSFEFARGLPGVTDTVVFMSRTRRRVAGGCTPGRQAVVVGAGPACGDGIGRRRASTTSSIFLPTARSWTRHWPRGCTPTTCGTGRTTPSRTAIPSGSPLKSSRAETVNRLRGMADLAGPPRRGHPLHHPEKGHQLVRHRDGDLAPRHAPAASFAHGGLAAQLPPPVPHRCAAGAKDAEAACAFLLDQPESHRTLPSFFPDPGRRALPAGLLVLPVPAHRRQHPRQERCHACGCLFPPCAEDRGFRRGRGHRHLPLGRAVAAPADLRPRRRRTRRGRHRPRRGDIRHRLGAGDIPAAAGCPREAAALDRLPGRIQRGNIPRSSR